MAKIKCPVCKCLESASAEVCRACGAALHDHPQNKNDQKIVTKAKCTVCGCLESADAEVCRACGAALQSVPVRETSFAQAVGGFFSWLDGGGFHGIDRDFQLYEDNISQNNAISAKPLTDFGSIDKDDSFDAENNIERPDPADISPDPLYPNVEGNGYHAM